MKIKFNSTQKKSKFASVVLALILTFSFNFTPISLFARKISDKVNAYKSSSTQTYYGNTENSIETSIGDGQYPSSLKKYFDGSSQNFNLQVYYQSRFSDLFKEKVNAFLKEAQFDSILPDNENSYNKKVEKYLDAIGKYESLSQYFDAKKDTDLAHYENFTTFFEDFVSSTHTHTIVGTEGNENTVIEVPAMFSKTDLIHDFYQSKIYQALANFINNENQPIENNDNITESTKDFYETSAQYKRVKDAIDKIIEETIAIKSYDNENNYNYMASIFATDAPTSTSYYYKDGDDAYDFMYIPNANLNNYEGYAGGSVSDSVSGSTYYSRYYYIEGDFNQIYTGLTPTEKASVDKIKAAIKDNFDLSSIESNPLLYRKLVEGEAGYINENFPVYVQFTNSNYFQTENTIQKIFVLNDEPVSESLQATYGSLHYFYPITLEELENDYYIKDEKSDDFKKDDNGKNILNENFSYVQIPYLENSPNGGFWFEKLFGYIKDSGYFQNLIDNVLTTTKNGTKVSKVYLKLNCAIRRIVYVDKEYSGYDAAEFKAKYPNYNYQIENIDRDEPNFSMDDYYEVESSKFSGYTSGIDGTKVFFKKTKIFYTKLDTDNQYETDESGFKYEMERVPDIKFETTTQIPSDKFVKDSEHDSENQIYVFGVKGDYPEGNFPITINEEPYKAFIIADESELSNIKNQYIKIPSSISSNFSFDSEEGATYTFFYKHELITEPQRQIYIIDNSENAKDNEVYKNLYYNVITEDEFNSKYYNYVLIDSSDSNYNKNFRLYYKYEIDLTPPQEGEQNDQLEKLFIKNYITGKNAIYVVDDYATSYDKSEYKSNYITVVTTNDFNAERDFYVQLTEQWLKDNGLSTDLSYNLYFKYKDATLKRKIYEYTNSSSSSYNTFYSSSTDYNPDDYELIDKNDKFGNYVSGANLYYKKIRTNAYLSGEYEYKDTYFYYASTPNFTLKANSYYAISFYAYTNGKLYDDSGVMKDAEDNELPLTASVYFTDSTNSIKEIAFENISTSGKWKKYYVFVATNTLLSSTIQMKLYMGDKNGIAGTYQSTAKKVTGVVLFDDIKITLINQTDYNKHTIDDASIYTYKAPESESPEENETVSSTGTESESESEVHADTYGNEIIVLDYADNRVLNTSIAKNWNELFDFENIVEKFIKRTPGGDGENDTLTSLQLEDLQKFIEEHGKTNYYTFDNSIDWHYYISESDSWQGNTDKFNLIKKAYLSNKAQVEIIDEESIYDDKVKAKEKEDEEKKKESTETTENNNTNNDDVPFIKNTFKNSNKILRIKNTDTQNSLGVVSAPIKIKQNEYYKISFWIYSPDKDASATVKLESKFYGSDSQEKGKTLSSGGSINAHLSYYTTTPTNEYGWISVSLFVEGNALSDSEVSVVLLADAKDTVYFDNFNIERITSSTYTTASTDSDSTTYVLQLSPSDSLNTKGITNGDFNSVNVTDNYVDKADGVSEKGIDYTKPRTAKNWTIVSGNSSGVVAGVIPTSEEYVSLSENFYTKYNKDNSSSKVYYPFSYPFTDDNYHNNIFAIYAPETTTSLLKDANEEKTYEVLNKYKIYSSSTSLNSNKTHEISFEFLPGYNFNGKMVANIYSGSYDASKLISSFKVSFDNTGKNPTTDWETFTFIIENGISSSSIYLEIGVEDATGTCFFQKARRIDSSYSSISEAKDKLLTSSENSEATDENLFNKSSLSHYKFINFKNSTFSIHSDEVNSNGTYDSKEFNSSLTNESTHTVGKTGVVVADFYTKKQSIDYYTVQIDNTTYYIKAEEVETDETKETVYKLYSDSVFKNELTEIGGKKFTIKPLLDGKIQVLLGNSETSYDTSKVEKTNYTYTFKNDVVFGNNFIPASELNNNISENVIILSNSLNTDYTLITPVYTKTLSTSAYYVLKIYVKTSEIIPLSSDKESGLNISISSIATEWTNIDTTKDAKVLSAEESDENNGFVCYQVLIQTNTSTVSNFGVQFSLGTAGSPCSGYAIIAGVTVETFENETLFNDYASTIDENDKTIKRFYGEASKSSDTDEEDEEENTSSTWATFFYIFSSLLLGAVLIIALVAIIVKKHPIKLKNKIKGTENVIITDTATSQTRRSRKNEIDILTESEKPQSKENENKIDSDDDNNEGFV